MQLFEAVHQTGTTGSSEHVTAGITIEPVRLKVIEFVTIQTQTNKWKNP